MDGVISIVERAGTGCLRIAGAVDVRQADLLLQSARELARRGGEVTVDVTDASHLDGSAWQILIALDQSLKRRGLRLRLGELPPALRAACAIGGFDFVTESGHGTEATG